MGGPEGQEGYIAGIEGKRSKSRRSGIDASTDVPLLSLPSSALFERPSTGFVG